MTIATPHRADTTGGGQDPRNMESSSKLTRNEFWFNFIGGVFWFAAVWSVLGLIFGDRRRAARKLAANAAGFVTGIAILGIGLLLLAAAFGGNTNPASPSYRITTNPSQDPVLVPDNSSVGSDSASDLQARYSMCASQIAKIGTIGKDVAPHEILDQYFRMTDYAQDHSNASIYVRCAYVADGMNTESQFLDDPHLGKYRDHDYARNIMLTSQDEGRIGIRFYQAWTNPSGTHLGDTEHLRTFTFQPSPANPDQGYWFITDDSE
jgi:hypothetical protein